MNSDFNINLAMCSSGLRIVPASLPDGCDIIDQRWHQLDFERHSPVQRGEQPGSLLRIIDHQRHLRIRESISTIIENRADGSTEPFSARNKPFVEAKHSCSNPVAV